MSARLKLKKLKRELEFVRINCQEREEEALHEKHVQFVIENFNLVYGGKQ